MDRRAGRLGALIQGHCLTDDSGLAAALAQSFALLEEGAADPASRWHSPTLATVGEEGVPRLRTVVLRGFDAVTRLLEIHTDIRSAKIAELHANPLAGLHCWDAGRMIQLRATGTVTMHTDDAVADAAWGTLRPATRETYRVAAGPGSVLADPSVLGLTLTDQEAREVFCVIRLHFKALEWLHLAQGSHRRARFTWASGGLTAIWLVP